jgi:hypothetical protein
MFCCNLCGGQSGEYVYVERHCSKCVQIRRIISLYSVDKVLDTLRFVYLRDDESKVENRTNCEYNLRSKEKDEKK